MQNSNINPSIKYIESSQIHSNDVGSKNIQVYEINLLNTPIFICVGNFNTDIENIIYVPISSIEPVICIISSFSIHVSPVNNL